MSTIEIKQKLKTLNQQLVDLESGISDPIERNESKQQLNRQIKKLERSLKNLEQFEIEQQELESLQSELTSNNHSTEIESVISESQPTKNVSFPTTVAINIEEYTPIKETKNQNSQPITPSQPIPHPKTSNGLKDWQKTVISSSIIGLFILIGLVLLKSNHSFQSSTSSPTDNQINYTSAPTNTSSLETSQQDNSSETEEIIESLPEENLDRSTTSENITNNYDFPLDSCEDKDTGGANNWYPVYVDDTPENLNFVRSNYCGDAIRKYRKQAQINSIQVASFTDSSKAEEFAELMRRNIGSGEVGEPTVYDFDNNPAVSSSHNLSINSNAIYQESHEIINKNDAISLIEQLYYLLSDKNFDTAISLYSPQLANQFNSSFFSKFVKVTVENLQITSITDTSINFIGQNTYIWIDGSSQKELRSYTVKNLNGELKITASQFIKVTKFR